MNDTYINESGPESQISRRRRESDACMSIWEASLVAPVLPAASYRSSTSNKMRLPTTSVEPSRAERAEGSPRGQTGSNERTTGLEVSSAEGWGVVFVVSKPYTLFVAWNLDASKHLAASHTDQSLSRKKVLLWLRRTPTRPLSPHPSSTRHHAFLPTSYPSRNAFADGMPLACTSW